MKYGDIEFVNGSDFYIMIENLKEFVCKLVEKQSKTSFPHLYIVDKETGPYRKIQQAINAAEPNSLIKVAQGFYEENLVINKPLIIEPKSIGQKGQNVGVVLLVESGIGIRVKMPYSQSQLKITGLKISHTGNSTELQMQLIQHQHILNIFEDDREKQADQLEHEYINRVSFNKIQNMIMLVETGKVILSMCVFSLKYLVKSCRILIPAICIDRQGQLDMTDSEIKGNQQKQTVGILCRLGVVNIKNSVISDHRQGGIIAWGIKDNLSKITKNKIQRNSIGVHALGEQFKMKICQNQITKNKLGVKVGLACEVEISRNYICENQNGIQAFSSFPVIYLNKINKNSESGIITNTYKKMICEAKIKKNVSITGNKQNGIVIAGENNKSKIIENYLIGYNGESGIKVCKESFPLILKNIIYKNYNEGILVTEESNAVIEKNLISKNIQCGIAMGGVISHHSLIVENQISGSQGPGIIVVEGLGNIYRNDIVENLDGIKLISSSTKIRRNFIANNENDGLVCEGQCNPTLVENLITRNASIGLFLRSDIGLQSDPVIFSNIIVSNEVNVGLQFVNENLTKNLKISNTIQGTIHKPESISCSIM